MSNIPRLKWEPTNLTPLTEIEEKIRPFVEGNGGATILKNGTLLLTSKKSDDIEDARLALSDAKFLIDFRVKQLPTEDYLVVMHDVIGIFVAKNEFKTQRSEVEKRVDDLKFPSEELLIPDGWTKEEFFVGLYGRGKLQRDIYEFGFHLRI